MSPLTILLVTSINCIVLYCKKYKGYINMTLLHCKRCNLKPKFILDEFDIDFNFLGENKFKRLRSIPKEYKDFTDEEGFKFLKDNVKNCRLYFCRIKDDKANTFEIWFYDPILRRNFSTRDFYIYQDDSKLLLDFRMQNCKKEGEEPNPSPIIITTADLEKYFMPKLIESSESSEHDEVDRDLLTFKEESGNNQRSKSMTEERSMTGSSSLENATIVGRVIGLFRNLISDHTNRANISTTSLVKTNINYENVKKIKK